MHDNKLFYRSLYTAAIVGASSLLFSCNDDIHPAGNDPDRSDCVSFSLDNTSRGKISDTRSIYSQEHETERAVLRAAGSSDTLCLRTVVTEGIDLGKSTRGTQVLSADNLASFGCLAYLGTTPGTYSELLIDNAEYNRNGDKYQSADLHYWPGKDYKLKFYCYAPFKANGVTTRKSTKSTIMQYVVPKDVSKQQDLMLATTEEVNGDKNALVPLTFRHLLSAVRIVAGENMPEGTVKSVTFEYIYGSANIDMNNPFVWTEYADYTNFTVEPNVKTTGQKGQIIVGEENTLLMLPQDMQPESLEPTKIKVVFNDGTKDRTLTAPLKQEWKMGDTYTYTLSITPEYELDFAEDNPTEVDAHYLIVPIKIKAGNLNGKSYTLASADPNACKLRNQLIGPEEYGYWPKEDTGGGDFKRQESVTLSMEGESIVYAFVSENATETDRIVELQLQYDGKTVKTLTINQLHPIWDGKLGWENEEEDKEEKPYGFAWTRKVTYKIDRGFSELIAAALKYLGGYNNGNGIQWEHNWLTGYKCSLDYGNVQSLTNVYSLTDGLENTKHFTENNAINLESLENSLKYLGSITSESGNKSETTDFAALVCLKKNPATVEKNSQAGQTAYIPSISPEDIKWYLPAIEEFTNVPEAMNGSVYWSSTAIEAGNSKAYMWNGSSQEEERMENHRVRAVRVKE